MVIPLFLMGGLPFDLNTSCPESPNKNAYIERYNRTVRGEWLSQYGHRRHHTRYETENSRVNSTTGPYNIG